MPDISEIVSGVAGRYPEAARAAQLRDRERIAFHLRLIADNVPPGGVVMDLGGGLGMLSPCIAAAGFTAILVDDFNDDVNRANPLSALGVHDDVRVLSIDVTGDDFQPVPESLDGVSCIDSLEHWHGGPRPVLHKLMGALRPGGYFLLGVPNCVDLKKRVTTPFGMAPWSPFEEWYDKPVFRGHVREPDVRDLRSIAFDLGLANCRIFGRNWEYYARGGLARAIGRLIEPAPSLCSTIYLEGCKLA